MGQLENKNVVWDFGDGKRDTGRIVVHRYDKPGSYRLAIIHTITGRYATFVGRVDIAGGKFALKPKE